METVREIMEPCVIKTRQQYEEALAVVEEMMGRTIDPGSKDGERLELFALLVENYEKEHFAIGLPSPIEALRFRMEQQGLTQRDLVPYFGSRAKVSEVLSGKRPLTLVMIRALVSGLGLPADVLLQDGARTLPEPLALSPARLPLKLMAARGYFTRAYTDLEAEAEELVRGLIEQAEAPTMVQAFCRRSRSLRSGRTMDQVALTAWCLRVLSKARTRKDVKRYAPRSVDAAFLVEVARQSWSDQGPLLAKELLARSGIALVVEPHLPKTHLDGVAMLGSDGRPVIGMTLRHDRLDNFWFTLLHELAHVQHHLHDAGDSFVDDLDFDGSDDPREAEADDAARDALIVPSAEWETSPVRQEPSTEAIREFADRLRIHPAIVAGRIRHERHNYQILGNLVGARAVRRLFSDVPWGT
jgi:HTH-type transcriptional regulator / antitoxin HigA